VDREAQERGGGRRRCATITCLAAVATGRLAEVGVVALHRLALHEGGKRLLDRVVASHLKLQVEEGLLALAPVRAGGRDAGAGAGARCSARSRARCSARARARASRAAAAAAAAAAGRRPSDHLVHEAAADNRRDDVDARIALDALQRLPRAGKRLHGRRGR